MKRLSFLFTLTLVFSLSSAFAVEGEWISLFNGQNMDGWKIGENPSSFKIEDGAMVCSGPIAHAYYVGSNGQAEFKNFELKADIMTTPGANSGVYFHTTFQEKGFPNKGYEVQVNNTHIGEGNYYEFKKSGSLYAIRNVYKQLVPDNEWFTLRIVVRGKNVQIFVNDMQTVDYTETEEPVRGSDYRERLIGSGTFAIQCHDEHSRVLYKSIAVRELSDSESVPPLSQDVVDDVYEQIARLHSTNFPLVDFHIHLKGGLTLEEALQKSREAGINYGIAVNCGIGFPITNDAGVNEFFESVQNQPCFVGLQGEGREWMTLLSKESIAKFDYVFTDAMTFTDDNGRRTRIWIPEETFIEDKQAFMEMYLDRIQKVINNEPIDIYVNPTFLPEAIAAEYDQLWTPERMQKVIDAAVKNNVAIEINNRYRIPSAEFIKRAKKAGAKFSIGTNNGDKELGRAEYALEIIRECGLTANDMFMPKSHRNPKSQKK